MSMKNFPMVPQPEAMEDVQKDYRESMNILDGHKSSLENLRLKWSECGELNPTREQFLVSAEAYLVGYYDLARKTFPPRARSSVPRALINPDAPPLVQEYTFSRRYSMDLLKHPEMHQAFNPIAPEAPAETAPSPPAVESNATPSSNLHSTPTSTSSSTRGEKQSTPNTSSSAEKQQQQQQKQQPPLKKTANEEKKSAGQAAGGSKKGAVKVPSTATPTQHSASPSLPHPPRSAVVAVGATPTSGRKKLNRDGPAKNIPSLMTLSSSSPSNTSSSAHLPSSSSAGAGTAPAQGGDTRGSGKEEAPSELVKRLAALEYQQRISEQAINKLKRDANADRESNSERWEQQKAGNIISVREVTAHRHRLDQLDADMDRAFEEVNTNRDMMREAAPHLDNMIATFRRAVNTSCLNPRLQGRLGGKFALPSSKARAKAIKAAEKEEEVVEVDDEDEEYEDISDDEDDFAVASGSSNWADASEDVPPADGPPEYALESSSASTEDPRPKRKKKNKGKGKGRRFSYH